MITHLLRATPSLARISVARHVAYRAEMTIWILTAILPLIMLALWNAVAQDEAIAGYGQAEMARYFVAALICRQLTGAWVVWELNFQIRTGRLSTQLLRPLHPLWVYAVWMLSALPFRLLILSPLLAAVTWWRPDLFVLPDPAVWPVFLVSITLAWWASFLIQCAFGLLAFWLDKSDGLFGVWFSAYALLSGYVAPLAFFPETWQTVLAWLPFRGMLAVPVELLGGFMSPADAGPDLLLQAFWTAAFAGLTALLWKRGLRRYGAFGA